MLSPRKRNKNYKKMYANLGQQFTHIRKELGLSREEVAAKYNFKLVTLIQIETGEWNASIINMVMFLASCYGKTIECKLVDSRV